MKKLLWGIVVVFLLSSKGYASNDNYNIGARATAMGHTSVVFNDLWSVANNQAGMAFVKRPVVGIAYEERFMKTELGLKTVAVVLPTRRLGSFGISYTHFGDSDYNETRINFGYAMKLGRKFSVGLAFNYLGMSVSAPSEGGSTGTVTGELGVMASPVENLWFSAHIFNPLGISINNYQYEEEIPVLLRLGVLYYFDKDILIAAEVEKDIDFATRVKSGVEYTLKEKFIFRAGIATHPTEYSAGIGFFFNMLRLDLGFYKHQYLGYTPSISLAYSF